ncbi:hypothetical protein [Corynebacterium stationis]|uniref:hypothetical protein n=1 Tax=Corynebacterium stationis TaxID=1705 RepID=UPI0028A76DD0|nr:hypothetical protein [Corynebacterium stationis]
MSDILGFAGVALTAILTWVVARGKLRLDAKTAKKNRLDELEEKYYELTDRLDKEVLTRRQAETQAWNAGLALKQAIDFIRVVTLWIENGAKPPAPTPPDADALEAKLPPAHQN